MSVEANKVYCCECVEYCDKIDITTCKAWKWNKNIAEFEKAKQEFINEIKKPFVKFLDWLDKLISKSKK